ncbi:RICIN domain-containing protein [Ideonella sp. DXS29W]|uniref:RICIN domain-containing protein n=1 Tax=Ideonella lacteola TaxID=2984193 RepID=A0ABU9BMQ9_9BURK
MKKTIPPALAALALLSGAAASHAQTKCDRYDTVPVLSDTYIVQNNFYNPAGGSQCINVDAGTGSFSVTGNNQVPTNGAPGGYPSIYKGCHWGGCTKNSGLPLVLGSVNSAPTKWSVTPPGPGQWNISYDVWFAQTPTPNGQPDGTEIMVWINRSGSVTPAGHRAGNVNINGMDWEVWEAPIRSAGFNETWHIVSYVATSPRNEVNFDLKPFFNDARNRNLLSDSWYLIDVEAGFEIWQNGYNGRSNYFEVDFNKGTPPPPPPPGIDPNRWYSVVNVNSGACVDDAEYGTKNGAKLQQWACNSYGQPNQNWQFKPTSDGYYKVIVQQEPVLAWDVAEWGTNNGSPIQLWTYGGGQNQQWMPVSVGGGAYKFIGRSSGKCLDVPSASKANGVQLQLWDCNGTAAQSFRLVER